MKKLIGLSLMVLSFATQAGSDFDELDWSETYAGDNLKVYVAAVPDSNVKAFRGVSIYEATVDQLVRVILDAKHFSNWAEGVVRSSVVEKQTDKQWFYFENKIPFPYSNRDAVVKQYVTKTGDDEVTIHLASDSARLPDTEGKVRIQTLTGAWVLKAMDDERVELTYQVHLDPAGQLPSWIVNLILTDTPKKTLKNLHKVDLSPYTSVSAVAAVEMVE